MEIKDAWATLELSSSSALNEIEEAYRTLTKVWHPDRFMHDEKLLRLATEKTKRINHAVELLRRQWARERVEAKGTQTTRSESTFKQPGKSPTGNSQSTNSGDEARHLHDMPWKERLAYLCGLSGGVIAFTSGFVQQLAWEHGCDWDNDIGFKIMFCALPFAFVPKLLGFLKKVSADGRST